MEIKLIRDTFTDRSTIGTLSTDDGFHCYVIEDRDRGLYGSDSLDRISKIKVKGQTAIPYGRYQVIITKSDRFSLLRGHDVYLPLLLNVPGFEGIRIHTGNKPEDTEGCLLPGMNKATDLLTHSTEAWTILNDKINAALKSGQKVWITIDRSNNE